MLVTTCPGCDTTFKLTVAILETAGGQVRCGRCARIFDANSRLREQPEAETERLPATARETVEPVSDDELALAAAATSATGTRWYLRDDPAESEESAAATDESHAAESDAGTTDAEPAEAEPAALEAAAADEPAGIVDADIADPETVEPDAAAVSDPAATDWREALPEPGRRRTWPWAVAAGLAALTLATQLIHAARSELAALPGIGPALIAVYAGLGREVAPPIVLAQYSTLDLTAVAEPVTDEHGWLIIETRVQNRGPKAQPYPHILVRLLDRWEKTIAGRYFAPDEYVVTPQQDYSRMNAGSTVDAQFIIVDPGPDATGFELEFCAKVEGGFDCESQ